MSEHHTVEKGDALIERARGEIRAQAATLCERPLLERDAPPVAADERIDRARLAYRIGELTDAHHRAFVEQAFHALLKRAPTPAEAAAHLALLATGATKAEALGNLRWSPEGRAIGARVAGLAPRYAMAKLRRVPLLGYLVDIPLNLAALPALARHQRASDAMLAAGDAAAAQSARDLGARVEALDASTAQAFVRSKEQAALAHQRIDDLHAFAHELNVARDALGEMCNALRSRIETLEGANANIAGRFDELEFIRQRFYAINHWTHHLEQAFARIESTATQEDAARRSRALQLADAEIAGDATRATRNAAWAKAFRAEAAEETQVLVCASGVDWSRELASLGCRVVHVDADAAAPRANGIDIESADAFDALRRCADASLDGIVALSASHLASTHPLLEWLAEAHRVLRPNAVLLLADAREACAIADELLRRAPLPAAALASWSPALFAAAGFANARRIDAADGTPAWLMRRAAA